MEAAIRTKKRILIAEDDDTFRDGLRYALLQGGFEPIVTVNGKIAQQLLAKGGVDLVISDINMPDGNGIELLKCARDVHNVPVILMTGMKSFIESKGAFSSALVNLIAKPFGNDELFAAIRNYFPEARRRGGVAADSTEGAEAPVALAYCKLPINDFISGSEIKHDLYVQLTDQKYVKIAYGGSSLNMEQILSYREKGVQYLYMRKEDFREYLKFNVQIGQVLKASPAIADNRKLKFLQQTSKLILQSALVNQVDEETLDQCTEVVESAVSILAEHESYLSLMDIMQADRGELYSHALAVSLYSSLMAMKLGWTSPNTIFYIAAGALFHDIGKKELPLDLLAKERALHDRNERSLYETHPGRGAEILRAIPETPDEVIRIVQQHHENESGNGYPFRMKKVKIYPLAKLVTVADEFVEAMEREPEVNSESVLRVLENMVKFSKNLVDPGMLATLMTVFRFEVPIEIRNQVSVGVTGGGGDK